jgi:hypothetical protein
MATLVSHQAARRGPAAIGAAVENSDREIAGLKRLSCSAEVSPKKD